jgi:glycosyltransferase involved in cell wall biosynthesis
MKKLSVIICCFNERSTIENVVQATKAVDLGPGWEREITVIDNNSIDGTREVLREMNEPDITIILNEKNLGKGGSIRIGIQKMTGDYMIIQDADSEYNPEDHTRFCQYVDKYEPAAIFGSRILGGDVKYEYVHAYFGVRFLTAMTNLLFRSELTDVATATKMVKADLVKALNLTCSGFDLDFELPDKIILSGHEIHEIAIDYDPRTYADGKKIKAVDGLIALKIMLRDRLGLSAVWKSDVEKKSTIRNDLGQTPS